MSVALVTGSSRGIGAACAQALARSGYKVCINCIERMDLAQALAVGNAADDAPEQDAPDLDAASHDVLFPGVEQPAARPEPPAHDDGDTTQIDLGSWQTGAAQEQAPAGERKWGRLLGLFAQNQDDPEDD